MGDGHDLLAQSVRYIGGIWPGWVIIIGVVMLAAGAVMWIFSDSVSEILRGSRNPLISEETAEQVYTSDHTKLGAAAAGTVGLLVIVLGVIATIADYIQ